MIGIFALTPWNRGFTAAAAVAWIVALAPAGAHADSASDRVLSLVRGCYRLYSGNQLRDDTFWRKQRQLQPVWTPSAPVFCVDQLKRGTYRTAPQPYLALAIHTGPHPTSPSRCYEFPVKKGETGTYNSGGHLDILYGDSRKTGRIIFRDLLVYVNPANLLFAFIAPPSFFDTLDLDSIRPSLYELVDEASLALIRLPDDESRMVEMFRNCHGLD